MNNNYKLHFIQWIRSIEKNPTWAIWSIDLYVYFKVGEIEL